MEQVTIQQTQETPVQPAAQPAAQQAVQHEKVHANADAEALRLIQSPAAKSFNISLVSFDSVESTVHAGLAYLGAVLRQKGHQVRIFDISHLNAVEKIEQEFRTVAPDVLGLSFYSISAHHAYELAQRVKERFPNCKVLAGGPHASMAFTEIAAQPHIDFAIISEGEATVAELTDAFADGTADFSTIRGIAFTDATGKVIVNERRPFIDNLDILPIPDYSLFKMSEILKKTEFPLPHPALGVIFCRGCPYQCTFCQPMLDKIFGMKTRKMSPERAVEIVMHLKKHYGIRGLSIKDDTFLIDKEWVKKFCQLLIKKKANIRWKCNGRLNLMERDILRTMKSAGLVYITVPFEAGADRIRNLILNKRVTRAQIKDGFDMCREVGIFSHTNIMIGTPTETEEEIQESVDMLDVVQPDSTFVYFTTLIPATYMYEKFQDYVSSTNWRDFRHYSEGTKRNVAPEKLWYYQELVTRQHREVSLRKFLHSPAYRRTMLYRWWTYLITGNPHKLLGEMVFLSNVDYLLGRKHSRVVKVYNTLNGIWQQLFGTRYCSKIITW